MATDRKAKWLYTLMTVIPLITFISGVAFWVDGRYMHRNISDTRYLDIQIKLVEKNLRDFQRLKDTDAVITSSDETNYHLDLKSMENLMQERNRLLGLSQ